MAKCQCGREMLKAKVKVSSDRFILVRNLTKKQPSPSRGGCFYFMKRSLLCL